VNQDDSDIQYLNEVDRFEESYLRKKVTSSTILVPNTPNTTNGNEENQIPLSQQRKRKELSSPDSSELAEITSFQFKGKAEKNDDDDIIVDLVKPIAVNKPHSSVSTSKALFKVNYTFFKRLT
jgi:hypothetical protein